LSGSRDFWLSCGHHLLDRDAGGGLLVTNEFLKAYLARPEITPPAEACAAERALHGALLVDPRQAVSPVQIAAIADVDARENWEVMVAFRDHLACHRTLEAAYLDIVRRNLKFPHVFLNQIVHVILRNVLHGCDDAFVLRAAELFFRPQKLTLHEGSLVAADEETVSGLGNQPLSPLVSMLGLPKAAEIDVLSEANADAYWERSDLFDMAPSQRKAAGKSTSKAACGKPPGCARRGRQALDRPSARGRGGDRAVGRAAGRDADVVCWS